MLIILSDNILADYGKTMTWDIKAGLMCKPEKEAALHLLSFFPDIPLTTADSLAERDRQQEQQRDDEAREERGDSVWHAGARHAVDA